MPDLAWTRSSRCDSGSCVEATSRDGVVLVRDSKLGDQSPILSYTQRQWQQLLTAVKSAGGPRTAIDGVVYARPSGRVLWDTGDRPLVFTWAEWVAFVAGVKAGDFDPDRLAQTDPETAPSATHSAETAPPVPQDTPSPIQAQGDAVTHTMHNPQAGPPTVLKFRSKSGRTEVARRGDGTISIRVLTGQDRLDRDDANRLAAALAPDADRIEGVARA